MKRVDLMPKDCRDRIQFRLRLRTWMAVTACWGVLVGTACLVSAVTHSTDASSVVHKRLESLQTQSEKTQQKAGIAQVTLNEVRQQWQANRSISEQPDWGILLALLTQVRDDRVTLARCSVTPVTVRLVDQAKAAKKHQKKPVKVMAGYRLSLDGLATSQDALSRYLIELERTGVMTDVALIESRAEKINGQTATMFTIECEMMLEEGRE